MYCRSILLGKSIESYYIDCQQRSFAHVLKHCDNDCTSPELSCVFSSSSRSITGIGEAERLQEEAERPASQNPRRHKRRWRRHQVGEGTSTIHNWGSIAYWQLLIFCFKFPKNFRHILSTEENLRPSRKEIVWMTTTGMRRHMKESVHSRKSRDLSCWKFGKKLCLNNSWVHKTQDRHCVILFFTLLRHLKTEWLGT